MTGPRVSVVVPTFNNVDFIAATMDSILAQTFTDFELVVADHSSSDGTWERLQPYAADPRVTLLQTLAGGGAVANWRRVSEAATAPLLKLVCGDDVIDPQCLAEQVAAMDAHPGVVLVAAKRDLIDAGGSVVVSGRGLAGLVGLHPGRAAVRRTVLVGANIFGEPACVLLRRTAFDAAGGWRAEHPFVIDQETYSEVLMHGDFYGVDRSLAQFRLNAGQWSVRLALQQSEQVIGYHHAIARRHPGLLSAADLRRGDLRARVTAYQRRAAYLWIGRRMRVNP